MGVIAERSRNITLQHVDVAPTPDSGRVVSITSDATHFVNCSGKIEIAHCLFECQKQDPCNIHGIHARIEKATDYPAQNPKAKHFVIECSDNVKVESA